MIRLLPIAFLLVLAGCAGSATNPTTTFSIPAPTQTALSTPEPTPSPESTTSSTPAPTDAVALVVKDFTLDPIDVNVDTGPFALAVSNQGPTVHNVIIRDDSGAALAGTRDLRDGESETIAVDLAPGRYVLFCSLPGHESLGIVGTLIVGR